MLSKIWKNLLLAICIIAILFNITSKLVNRISLEKTISSVPEGIDVKELLNIVEEENITEQSTTSTYNVLTEENTVSTYNVVEENTVVENTVQEENVQDVNTVEENVAEETTNTENNEESSNSGGIFDITDISDFTTLLY